jgi:hypothetical protein
MLMIDLDELKPTLKAWQDTAVALVNVTQAMDAAFLRGDQAKADEFHKQALAIVVDRNEKADYVAKLVEALIWRAENP